MRELTGIGVSAGTAVAPAAVMGTPITELPRVSADTVPDVEITRAGRALDEIADGLRERQERADGAAAQILAAQVLMARDPALRDSVARHAREGLPAPHAVDAAVAEFRSALQGAGAYMAERVADLDDIRNRAVARLLHLPMPGIPRRSEPFVLVADDLAPADTVDLDPASVAGLVTARGGPTSHTAIIAKALGLPAVVSCPDILTVAEGQALIIDGASGRVVVEPTDDEVNAARERIRQRTALLRGSHGPGRTSDGHPVALMVNYGGATDVAAVSADAEGIGLLRTEFLFLDRGEEPSVAEQQSVYEEIFAAFAGRKVVVRTLDVGADKPLPFVASGPGDNPALGMRGFRLVEHNAGLLDRQLEAIAAAAERSSARVQVMAPMIATVDEAATFAAQAGKAGIATVGVMVEIPALALQAEALADIVDFVSIGTNDLSQYTFAADRMVGELGALLDPWQPAVLELVARTARAVRAAGKPVGVCGEAASDPLLALVLTGFGVTSLSMAPNAIPEVRTALAAQTREDCRKVAEAAQAARTAAEARETVAAMTAG